MKVYTISIYFGLQYSHVRVSANSDKQAVTMAETAYPGGLSYRVFSVEAA